MSLSKNLSILVIAVAVFTGVVTAAVAYWQGQDAMIEANKQKLIAVGDTRRAEIAGFMNEIKEDLLVFAKQGNMVIAVEEFTAVVADIDNPSAILQHAYIDKNPYASNGSMIRSTMDLEYDTVHAQYHPEIRYFTNAKGYQDIFLI